MRKSRKSDKGPSEKQLYMELLECMESVARKYGRVLPNGDADGDWVMSNYKTLPECEELEMKMDALRDYNLKHNRGLR